MKAVSSDKLLRRHESGTSTSSKKLNQPAQRHDSSSSIRLRGEDGRQKTDRSQDKVRSEVKLRHHDRQDKTLTLKQDAESQEASRYLLSGY